MKHLLTILLIFLSAGSTFAVSVGEIVPEIKVQGWINSNPLTLHALRGKLVVLEFWATWCPPCRRSIPHLIRLYKKMKDKPLAFLSLTSEPKSRILQFNRKNPDLKMPYPVGYGSRSSSRFEVQGIPHAFVIDKNGKLIWRGHPMSPGFEKAIQRALHIKKTTTSPTSGNRRGKDEGSDDKDG